MESTAELLDGAEESFVAEFFDVLDTWANEVLKLRADTIVPGYDPYEPSVVLDDLVGAYVARDWLDQLGVVSDLSVVRAVDELLLSVTEEAGRGWLELTGMEDMAGQGWWWSRLPVAADQQVGVQKRESDG